MTLTETHEKKKILRKGIYKVNKNNRLQKDKQWQAKWQIM